MTDLKKLVLRLAEISAKVHGHTEVDPSKYNWTVNPGGKVLNIFHGHAVRTLSIGDE
jgi:hypothetical protein